MNGSDGTAGLEKQDFMKDLFKFGRLLVAAAVLTCAAGCSDDKDGSGGGPELPDPEGTVLVSMRYSTKDTYITSYGGSYVYFQEYPVSIPDFTTIRLTSSGTLKGGTFGGSIINNWDEQTTNGTKFVTIGKTNGLAAVTSIPQSGWAEEVAALPGYGCVAEYNGVYCRIYVVDYMLDNAGNRIGVVLKYQAPFTPES